MSIWHRIFSNWATEYRIGRSLLVRGLALIYLIAIASWWSQVILLVGENGLVPMSDFLDAVGKNVDLAGKERFSALPTLFWVFGASDFAIHAFSLVGCLLAVMVIFGFLQGPGLVILWFIYLSFLNTGGPFMSFQWDILLLEAGALVVLVAPWKWRSSWKDPKPLTRFQRVGMVFFWFLIAKLMFFSGWVKLAWATESNPEWWPAHTAMTFHYMTQPLPTWTAWWMHQLPEWFQRACIWPMYLVELVFPFLILFGKRAKWIAAIGFAWLMVMIALTGNYTFFNLLTVVLCIPLVADRFWMKKWIRKLTRISMEESRLVLSPSRWRRMIPWVSVPLFVVLGLLNVQVVLGDLHRAPIPFLKKAIHPQWLDKFSNAMVPWRMVSGYGLFRTMTTDRPEIIFEGSRDGTSWEEYDFCWKVDRLDARPRFVAPHQPRVAWQLWFAALERRFSPQSRNARWIESMVVKLLDGDESVQALFERNPFPQKPPQYIRARLYRYEFTNRLERRKTGDWWRRVAVGEYLPVVNKPS